MTVTFSPSLLFANYYINACIAHNIYLTYYDYRKSYDKRMIFYKYSILALTFVMYFITIFNVDLSKFNQDKNFTLMLYKTNFLNFFYIFSLLIIAYIVHKVYFILIKENDLLTLGGGKNSNSNTFRRKC
jgi:hypothetical protein